MSDEISAVQHDDSIDISEEEERELIPGEGYIVDYITGEKLVKDTPKEQVRQFIARALEQEYNIALEDMQADFAVAVEKVVELSTSLYFIIKETIRPST
jgi:hypothetical protein